VGKPEGNRPLGRQNHKWMDNIKKDVRKIECDEDWIALPQARDGWSALVKTVMNLRVSYIARKFLTNCTIGSFSIRAQLHEFSYLSMALQPFYCFGRFFTFLNLTQSVRLLGWGIILHTYTQNNTNRINAQRYPCLEWIRNQDPSFRADEDGSCLRPCTHCDRR
jgi:hypothetical protein